MFTPMVNVSLLFPDAAKVIREAASSGVVREANPMTAPGGRVPKTDPDTLASLNAPCSTCGHSYLSHNVGGTSQCFFCTPKGSQHTYHESPDMSPHLVKVPTLTSEGSFSKPEAGITGMVRSGRVAESSGVVADEYNAAADRILETYFASMGSPDERSNKAMKDDDTQRRALMLYNAHSTAAHKSSSMAYQSGGDSSASHQVAAEHHKLAGDAANEAADKAKNPQAKKDLQTAAKYHSAQATAHKAAASTQQSGNRQPYSWETSGHDY